MKMLEFLIYNGNQVLFTLSLVIYFTPLSVLRAMILATVDLLRRWKVLRHINNGIVTVSVVVLITMMRNDGMFRGPQYYRQIIFNNFNNQEAIRYWLMSSKVIESIVYFFLLERIVELIVSADGEAMQDEDDEEQQQQNNTTCASKPLPLDSSIMSEEKGEVEARETETKKLF
ncbi:MAG: hypothetical protein MHMPM18_000760 [Marteilia pararefringens]